MKAKFRLDLSLEQREVIQNIGINSVEDMDNRLFKEIYTILDSVNKRIQKVVDKYYGVPSSTTEIPQETDEGVVLPEGSDTDGETQDQPQDPEHTDIASS